VRAAGGAAEDAVVTAAVETVAAGAGAARAAGTALAVLPGELTGLAVLPGELTGLAEEIVTGAPVSATIAMSDLVALPALTCSVGVTVSGKPSDCAITVYGPGLTSGNEYNPSLPEIVVRIVLPSSFVAVTVAPAIGALAGVVTSPAIVPNGDWAFRIVTVQSSAVDKTTVSLFIELKSIVLSSVKFSK
jgi:hypothetical protein